MEEGAADTNPRRVLRVLRYLAGHRPALTSAIVRDCQLPRTTAYGLLKVLKAEEFVEFDPVEKRWSLGPCAYEVASAYRVSDALAWQSSGVLARLAAESGALMAAVGVLEGTEVTMVATEHARREPGASDGGPGMRYPAHLTATGKALLACRPRGELMALYGRRPLARPAGRGPGTVEELVESLREVCERGFAESAADLGDGLWAVAAPVHAPAGRVVAAVGVAFRERPPAGGALRRATEMLASAAAEVSSRLGTTAPVTRAASGSLSDR
jgi:DNA-binding IclR family transcriptional regulator